MPVTGNCGGVLSLISATDVISESQVIGATLATVKIDTTLTNALPILIFNDASQVSVPSSVTIPAVTNMVRFSIGAINNGDVDGNRSTTITVRADGWTPASASLKITDDDTPTHRTIGGNLVGQLPADVYWVTASLTIQVGQKLTIAPSSTLLFTAGTGLTYDLR